MKPIEKVVYTDKRFEATLNKLFEDLYQRVSIGVAPTLTPTALPAISLPTVSSPLLPVFTPDILVDVRDYGAVLNGTTDDLTPFQRAVDSLGVLGGTVVYHGKALLDGNLTVKKNVTLADPLKFIGTNNAVNFTNMGALILNSAATITLESGAGILGSLIYRKGMTFPTTNAAAFAGTAITIGGSDCFVFNSMILGFNKLIYSFGRPIASSDRTLDRDRIHLFNVQGDGVNGIEIINCWDIGRLDNIHLWPFSIYPNTGTYIRTGTALKFTSGGDWNKVTNSFSWGYKHGYHITSCNSMTLLSCGADNPPGEHTDSVGFMITGGSTDTRLIGCQSAGHMNAGYYINTTLMSGLPTRLIGCDAWYTGHHGVLVDVTGDVAISAGTIRNCGNGISINNATSKVLIDQVRFRSNGVNVNKIVPNPYVFEGFNDYGSGWVNSSGGGGTPGGLNTHVQYNDAGAFGGDAYLTWNKVSKLLTALNIAGGGMSLGAQSAGSSGNILYINGESTFTGNLIRGALNSVVNFTIDKDGKGTFTSLTVGGIVLQPDGHILLQNTKGVYGVYSGGNRELIDINASGTIGIGTSAAGGISLGYGAANANPIYIQVGGVTKQVVIDVNGFLKGV